MHTLHTAHTGASTSTALTSPHRPSLTLLLRTYRCSELRQLELPLRPDMPINPLPTVEQLSNLGRLSLMSQGSIPQVSGRLPDARSCERYLLEEILGYASYLQPLPAACCRLPPACYLLHQLLQGLASILS